ncbi:MAG: permease prefix domain 1-containing protein [Bacteroidota bacterium]
MFRLEDEIQRWRKSFQEDIAFTNEDIDELESHLRETFQRNIQEGMNESEAFQVASLALGQSKALRKEYINAKSASWLAFSFLRALYLIVGLFAFVIAQVYQFKTGYAPSLLYSTNVFNGLSVFAIVAWWLPVLTIFTAFTFIKNSTVKLFVIILATLLIVDYISAPYRVSSFIYDNESLFRTSFLILVISLFFREAWAWRLTVLVTGVYLFFVSISMMPSILVLAGLPADSILIVLVTTVGDPIIGVMLGYALFRQKQGTIAITSIAKN